MYLDIIQIIFMYQLLNYSHKQKHHNSFWGNYTSLSSDKKTLKYSRCVGDTNCSFFKQY
jgi:hypothetical protein